MTRNFPQTVVLGFDALSFRYLDAFELPNFESLRARGVESRLRATFPPWTGSAWPSMYTGTEPGHHGAYSFFDFADRYPDDAELVSRNTVRAPAIWDYLSEDEIESIVLNVPVTHPANPIHGTLVPGYLAPEDATGYPASIRAELDEALGEPYRIYLEDEVEDGNGIEALCSLLRLRGRAGVHLLETREWEFAFLQFQKTDTVFHRFDDEEAFRRVYEAADDVVGDILDTVDEEANVVVCSDHGIGPTTGYNVYLNEILRQHGYVEASSEGRTPTLTEGKANLTDGSTGGETTGESTDTTGSGQSPTEGATGDANSAAGPRSITNRALSAAVAGLWRAGITPGDVYAASARIGLDGALKRLLPDDVTSAVGQHVDWRASTAYCRTGPELGIRLNLQGREENGVVPETEYEQVREDLIELLSALETPDGESVFEWVRRREAVYDGPQADAACDVLFLPSKMNHLIATNLLGRQFVPLDQFNHKQEGVFIGAGPGFDTGARIEEISLDDVAPIVMGVLGRDVPARMTGSVPEGMLVEPVGRRVYDVDVQVESNETPREDRAAVESRLEDLGYL